MAAKLKIEKRGDEILIVQPRQISDIINGF
jgi:hypothetical protein